eukprot:g6305.t1
MTLFIAEVVDFFARRRLELERANEKLKTRERDRLCFRCFPPPKTLLNRARLNVFISIFRFIGVLIFGGLLLHLSEGWSYLDAIYFSFQISSTIGYGDQSTLYRCLDGRYCNRTHYWSRSLLGDRSIHHLPKDIPIIDARACGANSYGLSLDVGNCAIEPLRYASAKRLVQFYPDSRELSEYTSQLEKVNSAIETVPFGDSNTPLSQCLCNLSDGAKYIVMFYCLISFASCAWAIDSIVSLFSELGTVFKKEKGKRKDHMQMKNKFYDSKHDTKNANVKIKEMKGDGEEREKKKEKEKIFHTPSLIAFLFVYVILGSIALLLIEKSQNGGSEISENVIDSFYFVVISLTTIGYGDLTLKSSLGRSFIVIYCIFGLAIGGLATKSVCCWLQELAKNNVKHFKRCVLCIWNLCLRCCCGNRCNTWCNGGDDENEDEEEEMIHNESNLERGNAEMSKKKIRKFGWSSAECQKKTQCSDQSWLMCTVITQSFGLFVFGFIGFLFMECEVGSLSDGCIISSTDARVSGSLFAFDKNTRSNETSLYSWYDLDILLYFQVITMVSNENDFVLPPIMLPQKLNTNTNLNKT